MSVWTEDQFEEMSWHDNHVHALRVIEGEHGAGQFVLDLDYITEWVRCEGDTFRFRIVPATLTFREVTNLRIDLDYATPTAALGPFSIHAVERYIVHRERYDATIWKIIINWPKGEISFEAHGYEQRASGVERLCDDQVISARERYDDS